MHTISVGAAGIGDAVLGLQVAAAYERLHGPVRYLVSPAALSFITLFTGVTEVGPPADHGPYLDLDLRHEVELATRSALPRVQRYCRNVGLAAPDPSPPLRDPDAVRAAGADCAGAVALCPFTTQPSRRAPRALWAAAAAALAAAGHRVVTPVAPGTDADGYPEPVVCPSAARAAGVLYNATAVAGVDSGLTHLAAALGRPTLAVCGPTLGEKVFGSYPSAAWIDGGLACAGCYWRRPYTGARCDPGCGALGRVRAADVAAAVARLAAGAPARPAHLPHGYGPGVAYVGCADWPAVQVGCRLIREMGCQWPVQAWYRAGDPVSVAWAERHGVELVDLGATAADLEGPLGPDRALDGAAAVRYTNLDRLFLVTAGTYPCRLPCRLDALLLSAPRRCWADPDWAPVPGLGTFDRARGVPRPDADPCGGVLIGPRHPFPSGAVYDVDGHHTFVTYAGAPGPDLPFGPRAAQLLKEYQCTTTSGSNSGASATP